jgi:hypothetical protein
MISQKCPKCRSSRIRKGYKPTPLLFRLVGIHHLLCNHCNLLFTGFAVPGTVGKSSHKESSRSGANTAKARDSDVPGQRAKRV